MFYATAINVIDSAIETLQICDKQARKDTDKLIRFGHTVWEVLTSDKAMKCYLVVHTALGYAIEILTILSLMVINGLDRWIQSHEVQDAAPAQPVTGRESIGVTIDPRVAEICSEIREKVKPVFDRVGR